MERIFLTSEKEAGGRAGGDPWSDWFYYFADLDEEIARLGRKGYEVERLEKPWRQVWGGPAHPPVRVRHVVAIARK